MSLQFANFCQINIRIKESVLKLIARHIKPAYIAHVTKNDWPKNSICIYGIYLSIFHSNDQQKDKAIGIAFAKLSFTHIITNAVILSNYTRKMDCFQSNHFFLQTINPFSLHGENYLNLLGVFLYRLSTFIGFGLTFY